MQERDNCRYKIIIIIIILTKLFLFARHLRNAPYACDWLFHRWGNWGGEGWVPCPRSLSKRRGRCKPRQCGCGGRGPIYFTVRFCSDKPRSAVQCAQGCADASVARVLLPLCVYWGGGLGKVPGGRRAGVEMCRTSGSSVGGRGKRIAGSRHFRLASLPTPSCLVNLSISHSLCFFYLFFFFSLKWVGIGNHTWLLLWMTTENRTRSWGPGNKRVFFFGGISEGLTEAIGEPWTLAKDFIWFSAIRGFHTEYLLIKPLRKFCSCRKLCQNQFFFFWGKYVNDYDIVIVPFKVLVWTWAYSHQKGR